jgi:hypothetical protein
VEKFWPGEREVYFSGWCGGSKLAMYIVFADNIELSFLTKNEKKILLILTCWLLMCLMNAK